MIPLTTAEHSAQAVSLVLRPMIARLFESVNMATRSSIEGEPEVQIAQNPFDLTYDVSIRFRMRHVLR